MLKLETGRNKIHHNNKGFSLIEILVVLVITGIILGFVVLAFGDFGESRRLSLAGEHLSNLVDYTRTKAIIEARTYGINLNHKGYHFYEFESQVGSPNGRWRLIKNNRILRPTNFPPRTKTIIKISHKTTKPNITITATGHITPFTLTLNSLRGDSFELSVNYNGKVRFNEKER